MVYEIKRCEFCGAEFMPKNKNHRFCCEKCADASYIKRREELKEKAEHKTIKCVVCGKEFARLNNRQLCCSKDCTKVYQNKVKHKRKKSAKKNQSIVEIAVEARKEHLTYGQYVAKYRL